jgi:hypothetical protein
MKGINMEKRNKRDGEIIHKFYSVVFNLLNERIIINRLVWYCDEQPKWGRNGQSGYFQTLKHAKDAAKLYLIKERIEAVKTILFCDQEIDRLKSST